MVDESRQAREQQHSAGQREQIGVYVGGYEGNLPVPQQLEGGLDDRAAARHVLVRAQPFELGCGEGGRETSGHVHQLNFFSFEIFSYGTAGL